MADITIYKPATETVSVVDGTPPPDQEAKVAQATSQAQALLSQLQAAVTACQQLVNTLTA